MSDFSSPAVTRLEVLIDTNWGDCDTIYRVSQGNWYNWRDQIKAELLSAGTGITVPFAVLQALPETPDPGWGPANKTYRQQFALYYVRHAGLTSAEVTAGKTKVEDLIYPKVATMRDALLANVTSFQLFGEDPAVDCGDSNPANQVFSENTDNFWAGSVVFSCLVGESYI